MELELDSSEQAILDEIGAQLRAGEWADFVTVARLLRDWRTLARQAPEYAFSVYDYLNDLTGRDGLEAVLKKCPQPLRTKMKSAVEEADKEFLAGTQDDATRSLKNHFRIGAGWWWRRIPRSGYLAEYLAAKS